MDKPDHVSTSLPYINRQLEEFIRIRSDYILFGRKEDLEENYNMYLKRISNITNRTSFLFYTKLALFVDIKKQVLVPQTRTYVTNVSRSSSKTVKQLQV